MARHTHTRTFETTLDDGRDARVEAFFRFEPGEPGSLSTPPTYTLFTLLIHDLSVDPPVTITPTRAQLDALSAEAERLGPSGPV